MPIPSLPDECFSDILSFLDNESLYKCLFVNRYYCKLSIPIIWKDPFTAPNNNSISLINTLLSCLNEDEISSLIPFAIYLTNFNNQLLFEYGKFVRKIEHSNYIEHIMAWLNSSNKRVSSDVPKNRDCRVQKLVDAIYHMIMRKGSSLQEFVIYSDSHFIDLPKFSIFTTYKPGITNLRSLTIFDLRSYRMKHQNTIEFLSMVSEFCNCIIDCEVRVDFMESVFTKHILNIVKLQPLRRVLLSGVYILDIKKILYTLKEFRSETLKELIIKEIGFQGTDLSFISKFKFLERLEFIYCTEFIFKEKLHLKELKLCYDYGIDSNKDYVKLHVISMINLFCSEILHKLSLNIFTPETVKAVKETCPNLNFLCIEFSSEQFFNVDLTIPVICELSSLKTLNLKIEGIDEFNENLLIRLLCNHLVSVEYLFLGFLISLQNFEYFTSNCKVRLKRLDILVNNLIFDPLIGNFIFNNHLRKSYLVHANNFQKVHGSLKIFGIKGYHYQPKFKWTNEEIGIVDLLRSQGTEVVSFDNEFLYKLAL